MWNSTEGGVASTVTGVVFKNWDLDRGKPLLQTAWASPTPSSLTGLQLWMSPWGPLPGSSPGGPSKGASLTTC